MNKSLYCYENKKIYLKKNLCFLILFSIFLFLFIYVNKILFLKDPPVWLDEGLFLDMAINWVKTGNISTNLFNNTIPGLEKHAYWYPPLYFYLLGLWTNIAGKTIESIRLFSILLSIISLFSLFLIAKSIFKNKFIALMSINLISIDIWFSGASRFGRMEILVITFNLIALYFFILGISKDKWIYFFLSGLTCSLAFLTHPIGITLLLIFLVYIIFFRLPYLLFKILLLVFPTILLYFFWIYTIRNNLNLYLIQNWLQILRKLTITPYVYVLFKTNIYWRIEVLLYLYLLIALIIQTKKNNYFVDKIIIIGIILSAVIITISKEMWYIVYFQPFICLGIISLIVSSFKNKNKKLFLANIAAMSIYVFININYFKIIAKQVNLNKYDYHKFTQKISANLPKKGAIFLVSFPDPYMDLKDNSNYQLYEFPTVPVSDHVYTKLLYKVDYIILSGWLPNQLVKSYIDNNMMTKKIINHPNGYKTIIIQLKPRDQRI